ncbi:hypothetical protein F503_00716 [Ophiostoma piceae UAMH 11346]|uniref:Zn(2)-C6 fungal-type domain-containing protein n=1 Tax=Ophiostoma piceae (strain UAMH 11346) TaxID=1262450 RepID=S3C8B6_OPHP1|nr:hypothetical protein F503_00716 [Ophiostoma piceae UAMH 11346]
MLELPSVDRKIACDKTLPGCFKCQQRGKACEGYGLRLSWPKDDDVRRSVRGDHFLLTGLNSSTDYSFVYASMHDMDLLHGRPVLFDRLSFPGIPASLASLDPTWSGSRSHVPDVFVSATDEFTDLYGLLLRMSLTDNGPSALATRHALSALSFQSVGHKQTAYRHQTMAIRALQTAIEARMQPAQSFQAMAASMLLNYYETLDAHGSPLSSAIYFCGCKRIALSVHREHTDYEGDLALLLDWILYHDTMYKFSIHHWAQRLPQQQMVGDGPKIVSKPIFSPLRHVVNAAIGCSLELLEIICQIVDSVPGDAGQEVTEPESPPPSQRTPERTLRQLELRLDNIKQHVSVVSVVPAEDAEENAYMDKKSRLEAESRLYHIAAQLYLQRLGHGIAKDDEAVQNLLNEAFGLLGELARCRRPWPLFVIGVEARDETERHLVMACMAGVQLPKNMASIKRLIQATWTQLDLLSLDTAAKTISLVQVYNTVISANEFPPLFA